MFPSSSSLNKKDVQCRMCGFAVQDLKVCRFKPLYFTSFKCRQCVKGIVHPKMKILSSFTHPQVFQTCMNVFVLLNTKEDILKNVGNRAVLDHSIFFQLWKSMMPLNSLVTNFLQNIFLCVRQNKEIHTGLELLEGE